MVTEDQAARIIALLTEIRDRLPAPELPRPATMLLFGYERGSGQAPTTTQYRYARDLLNDDALHDGSPRLIPVVAYNLAREIVEQFDAHPCRCLHERTSLWDTTVARHICAACRRPIDADRPA